MKSLGTKSTRTIVGGVKTEWTRTWITHKLRRTVTAPFGISKRKDFEAFWVEEPSQTFFLFFSFFIFYSYIYFLLCTFLTDGSILDTISKKKKKWIRDNWSIRLCGSSRTLQKDNTYIQPLVVYMLYPVLRNYIVNLVGVEYRVNSRSVPEPWLPHWGFDFANVVIAPFLRG